jgi:hypothetical protein
MVKQDIIRSFLIVLDNTFYAVNELSQDFKQINNYLERVLLLATTNTLDFSLLIVSIALRWF